MIQSIRFCPKCKEETKITSISCKKCSSMTEWKVKENIAIMKTDSFICDFCKKDLPINKHDCGNMCFSCTDIYYKGDDK